MSDKAKGVLSWIFGIAAIIFICLKDSSRDVKYICAQSIVLWGISIISRFLGYIPYIGWLFSLGIGIFVLVLWIMGIVKICQDKQGDELELPLIGGLAKSIFGSVIEK